MTDNKQEKSKTSNKKQKRAVDADEGADKQPRKKPDAAQRWTPEEEQAVMRGAMKAALANITTIQQEEELGGRDRTRINMKLKGLARALDKQFGGSGKWVDLYISKKKGDADDE